MGSESREFAAKQLQYYNGVASHYVAVLYASLFGGKPSFRNFIKYFVSQSKIFQLSSNEFDFEERPGILISQPPKNRFTARATTGSCRNIFGPICGSCNDLWVIFTVAHQITRSQLRFVHFI